MTEAVIVVMHLQAKECQGLLENTKSQKRQGGFFPTVSTVNMALPTI